MEFPTVTPFLSNALHRFRHIYNSHPGVEKVPMAVNFKGDLLHICPVVSRIVGFPELNRLVQSLEIRYPCQSQL